MTEFIRTTRWDPTKKTGDYRAQSSNMMESPLIKKVFEACRRQLQPGYDIFGCFARLSDQSAIPNPHKDKNHFDLRSTTRLSSPGISTTLDFHDSSSVVDSSSVHSVLIPNSSAYIASRSILGSNGLGMFHSVSPTVVDGGDVQVSIILDIRESVKPEAPLKWQATDYSPGNEETLVVGDYTLFIDRTGSGIQSARGKIVSKNQPREAKVRGGKIGIKNQPREAKVRGGKIGGKMGDKAKKAAGGRIGDKAKKAAGGRIGDKAKKAAGGKMGDKAKKAAGGKATGDRKRHDDTTGTVDGLCSGCGRIGKTSKLGLGKRASRHQYRDKASGKKILCGSYIVV